MASSEGVEGEVCPCLRSDLWILPGNVELFVYEYNALIRSIFTEYPPCACPSLAFPLIAMTSVLLDQELQCDLIPTQTNYLCRLFLDQVLL